jgi:hypothetical protein
MNSISSIVTALLPIDAQLSSDRENVLPRDTKLVADLLVSECWIGKHRAQPEECSLAVAAIEAGRTGHVLLGTVRLYSYCCGFFFASATVFSLASFLSISSCEPKD